MSHETPTTIDEAHQTPAGELLRILRASVTDKTRLEILASWREEHQDDLFIAFDATSGGEDVAFNGRDVTVVPNETIALTVDVSNQLQGVEEYTLFLNPGVIRRTRHVEQIGPEPWQPGELDTLQY